MSSEIVGQLEQMELQLRVYQEQCDQAKATLENITGDINHKTADWLAGISDKPSDIEDLCDKNKALAGQCRDIIIQLKDLLIIQDITDTYLSEIKDLFTSQSFNEMLAITQSLKVLRKGKFRNKSFDFTINYIEYAGSISGSARIIILLFEYFLKIPIKSIVRFNVFGKNSISSNVDASVDAPAQDQTEIELTIVDFDSSSKSESSSVGPEPSDSSGSYDIDDSSIIKITIEDDPSVSYIDGTELSMDTSLSGSNSSSFETVSILADSTEEMANAENVALVGKQVGVAAEATASTTANTVAKIGVLLDVISFIGAIAFIAGVTADAVIDKKTYKKLMKREKQNTKDLKELSNLLQQLIDSLQSYYSTIFASFYDNSMLMLDKNDANYVKYEQNPKPTTLSSNTTATIVNNTLKAHQITQQKVTSWVTAIKSSLSAMITYNPSYGQGFDPAKVSINDIQSCVDNSVESLDYTDKTEIGMATNIMKNYWILKYNIGNNSAKKLIGSDCDINDSDLTVMKTAFLASQGQFQSTKDNTTQSDVNTTQRSKL